MVWPFIGFLFPDFVAVNVGECDDLSAGNQNTPAGHQKPTAWYQKRSAGAPRWSAGRPLCKYSDCGLL